MDDATASDNCGEVTIDVSSETTVGDAAGNYVIVRTFTATDDAGSSSSATQTITVQDTTAPEFTFVPADTTVECSDEMPMDDATASDNCGEVTIEGPANTAGDAAGNYVIVRTFTATDDAGNSSSATQTITLQDTTAPEFTFVPAETTVECSDEMPMDDATASDNCGEVTIEVSSERPLAMRRATTPSFARSLRPTMLETAALPPRPSRSRTPQRLSSPSSLPKPPSSAQTRCRWTTPRRRTTAVR